jgi:hypothetical protein
MDNSRNDYKKTGKSKTACYAKGGMVGGGFGRGMMNAVRSMPKPMGSMAPKQAKGRAFGGFGFRGMK